MIGFFKIIPNSWW